MIKSTTTSSLKNSVSRLGYDYKIMNVRSIKPKLFKKYVIIYFNCYNSLSFP